MDEREMIDFLRHYRHDWMNDVQLLMGYASLGKMDKVQALLMDTISYSDQERKLSNLQLPKTALWMISFNWRHDNFRMNYYIDVEAIDLSEMDEAIHNKLQEIMRILHTYSDKLELYEGSIHFLYKDTSDSVIIKVLFTGQFDQIEKMETELESLSGHIEVSIRPVSTNSYQSEIIWVCN